MFLVEGTCKMSNKWIADFAKIIEYIRSFPEVQQFLNKKRDVASQGKCGGITG